MKKLKIPGALFSWLDFCSIFLTKFKLFKLISVSPMAIQSCYGSAPFHSKASLILPQRTINTRNQHHREPSTTGNCHHRKPLPTSPCPTNNPDDWPTTTIFRRPFHLTASEIAKKKVKSIIFSPFYMCYTFTTIISTLYHYHKPLLP